MTRLKKQLPVAVIGMGCLFPGATDLKSYWRLLLRGTDAVTDVPPSHWMASDYYDESPDTPDHVYCTRGGFLPPVAFDPLEFGIPPNTLEATDTSQLLGLLAARAALEDAGYGGKKPFDSDRTSVILGVTGTQELVIPLGARLGHPKWRKALAEVGIPEESADAVVQKISDAYVPWQENSFPGLLGNVVAGRISNRLDLGGTNCVVDAACASSLSAVHLALLELKSGRSDMVLGGGVDTLNDIFMHMCFAKSHVLSSTGDARPFSSEADGTVLGEGIGILVFKRLEDAERDDDRIYAVIRGIGSSSDGKSQSIYAPRPAGQQKALRSAYRDAGVDPATIGLVEAHGTGTRVGDRVEFEALCSVFGGRPSRQSKTALGSVKSMIGHTKAAAGAAGLIKSILALHHKMLPPTLKAEKIDPKLNIEESPFFLNARSRPWMPEGNLPRRAGVSAFGFGGSNFHVVLEEHRPDKNEIAWDGSVDIVAFSGADRSSITGQLRDLLARLKGRPESGPHLAAETRRSFDGRAARRLLMVTDTASELEGDLNTVTHALESGRDLSTLDAPAAFFGDSAPCGTLAFLFPGQGSQYADMGRELSCVFPKAMASLEKANLFFEGPVRLTDLIYPPAPASPASANQALRPTEVAQPAIGAVSLAMLNVFTQFGIRPDVCSGHSFGELTALHAAGWIDETALLKLAVIRGRLMAEAGSGNADSGSMLAVQAPINELEAMTAADFPQLVLANRNSPGQGVLSGPTAAIEAAAEALNRAGFKSLALPVGAAFHSRMVDGARASFTRALTGIDITPTHIPVFANTTAGPYPKEPGKAAALLARQIARPVNFLDQIKNLYDAGVRTFVEIGPRTILSSLVRAILPEHPIRTIALDATHASQSAVRVLARTLCQLAATGYPVQLDRWESTPPPARRLKMRIPLKGANYRRPETPKKAPRKTMGSGAPELTKTPARDDLPRSSADAPPPNHPIKATDQPYQDVTPMKKETIPNTARRNALEIVQEGLRSMKALQEQTASAHQKFLESQTEASRTLQAMMSSIQHLAENGMDLPPMRSADSPAVAPSPSAPTAPSDPSRPESPVAAPETAVPGHPAGDEAMQHEPLPQPAPVPPRPAAPTETAGASTGLTSTLMDVVSDLTGYPLEMLGLEMNIEADLGIDSIKRVEILSTLEERIPNLPAVSPEVMGSLTTLAEIVAYLDREQTASVTETTGRAEADPLAPLSPAPPQPATASDEDLQKALLSVVSDLTGYPLEMLGLDMDIEADLGIDSIKRVEILSTLEEKLPRLPSVSPEVMGSLKTLGEIVTYLNRSEPVKKENSAPAPDAVSPPAPDAGPAAETSKAPAIDTQAITISPERYTLQPIELGLPEAPEIRLAPGRKVYITDDRNGLAQAIADALGQRGYNTVLVSTDILKFKSELPPACGLILTFNSETVDPNAEIDHAFRLTRHLAPGLLTSAAEGGAVFATVSRFDGLFGLERVAETVPHQGAFAGLVKTAAIEWPNVCCHAIDLDPHWEDDRAAAGAVVDTVLRTGPVEIGLKKRMRSTLDLFAAPVPAGSLLLDEGDVVVVSGGARGVTAAAALELARHVRPSLILLGRTDMPDDEPDWLSNLAAEKDIKAAILENGFTDAITSPVEVESFYRKVMAAREIQTTLHRLRPHTSALQYIPVDIRDGRALQDILQSVRNQYGPVAAVIHGAGVLEDKLIVDKRPEQFRAVYDTKVKGLQNLLQAVGEDPLKHLVLFSSVTARMGNKGQADYAMANEVLNKMARYEAEHRIGCRVVSVNWGPWEGGMVTGALKREFERQGVSLISLPDGARSLVEEMANAESSPVEVIIGGPVKPPTSANAGIPKVAVEAPPGEMPEYSVAFEREIDPESHPILNSHVIGGKAVVPLALIAEWICHGALHENPGLVVHGLDDLRMLKGIRFDADKKKVRLLAGKIRPHDDGFAVDVELRNGFENGKDVLHCRAMAVLTENHSAPPTVDPQALLENNGYHRTAGDIYADILFHGHQLHGIQTVASCTSTGMVASVSAAPSPVDWMKMPLRNSWIADPLILDSAFQMASLWCFEHHQTVSLPSYAAAYRQYQERFPRQGCTVVLEVTGASARKMRGDFTFLGENESVVARLSGFEAIMDSSLNRAFKPDYQTSN